MRITTIIKKYFFLCIILVLYINLYLSNVYAQNDHIGELFSKYNIELIKSDDTDSNFPEWAKPNNDKDATLNYRVDEVLPYDIDRNEDAYLVYPSVGIIVPVQKPSASDQALIEKGLSFDYLSYLQNGSLNYYGVSPSVSKGNMTIASHSSYYKSDTGRYKTVFQALPISSSGDIVQYFEKNQEGKYDLYEYKIVKSFETEKTDVSILNYANDDKYYLTTYGCYPLGTNEKRRVNQSILTRVVKNHSSLDVIHSSAPADDETKKMQTYSFGDSAVSIPNTYPDVNKTSNNQIIETSNLLASEANMQNINSNFVPVVIVLSDAYVERDINFTYITKTK